MSVLLGAAPEVLRVILVGGADFVSTLQRKDATTWPAGSQVSLEFFISGSPNVTWAANVAGSTASWNVDQNVVDTLIALRPRSVNLWYVEGALRLLWAQGEPEVRGV